MNRKNLDGGGNGIADETFSCLPSSEPNGGDLSTGIQLKKGDRRSHFRAIEKWYEITITKRIFLLFSFVLKLKKDTEIRN